MLHALLHFGLYAAWCASPALILLPVRRLDREPRNEIRHDQGDDGPAGDPGGVRGPAEMRLAALPAVPVAAS
jgi:hypothetical protein